MTNPNHMPKSQGAAYEFWSDTVRRLFKDYRIPFELPFEELIVFYHDNYTPMEFVNSYRTRNVQSALLNLVWNDEYGRGEIQFSTNEQIRKFYKQNPNIKKVMDAENLKFKPKPYSKKEG